MKKISAKNARNDRRRNRSKNNNIRHSRRHRLVVFRSNKNMSAQLIDDFKGNTLVSASSLDKLNRPEVAKLNSKIEVSEYIGKKIADSAKSIKIRNVVFDRNGYPYHGRVRALAEAARKNGLKF
tara:strand:+ start:2091 stop:2462 length:372 start_codon:yes stop_codon:yes gene_type:complete